MRGRRGDDDATRPHRQNVGGATEVLVEVALPVPANGGVFTYRLRDGSETEEVLLHQADMAMYEEKRRRVSHVSVVRSPARRAEVPELRPAD